MANSESSTDTQKYTLVSRDWNLPGKEITEKIKGIIQALNNKEIDAATILNGMDLGDANASIHIFGRDGNHFCSQELITKWLSLLVALASSENVTGKSIARTFTKGCGGCMVYTILMVVACFPDQENARLAFEFFRHVLADPKGEMLESHEVFQLASLLKQNIPVRSDGTYMRSVCLEVSYTARYIDKTASNAQIVVGLCDLIEGLGKLCTSASFIKAMKENSASTIEIVKESIKNKTFSEKFVEEKWR
jgi:hypothetical protein